MLAIYGNVHPIQGGHLSEQFIVDMADPSCSLSLPANKF